MSESNVQDHTGDTLVIVKFRKLKIEIEKLRKLRSFDDLSRDFFKLLALPDAPLGKHSIDAQVICEEYIEPRSTTIENEVVPV